ncbi:hypothetical protein QTI24_13340 [Variovorax sp. J22P240]|uniref:hypothetical protein n=1 Tax=Variovorax sp. J22P240 TaxID=3053514 RepID=UPI002578AC4A|nr:hypothetical protein [Variovorax sp. J22P240]MDL9999597.1 hypothetical protein [Variovorax sp. J22P240]
MLKTLPKSTLRSFWTPIRRGIEHVVRHELDRSTGPAIASMICRQQDFSSEWYRRWTQQIADAAPDLPQDQVAVWGPVWQGMRGKWLHRKLWEWSAVAQALEERDMLRPGRAGIGFAVGQEPLPSLFAARGVDLVASDFHSDGSREAWAETGQLGDSLKTICWPKILSEAEFGACARYRNIDMRNLGEVPKEAYDFNWSSCSFEHLGSLEAGLQFLIDSLECLKPGGIAVHTTEFNVSSNDATVEIGDDVIYRRKDIEAFDLRLRGMGCGIESLNFDPGHEQHDLAYDFPPWYTHGRQHLKLKIHGFVSTSILLIIRKPL